MDIVPLTCEYEQKRDIEYFNKYVLVNSIEHLVQSKIAVNILYKSIGCSS